MIWRFCKSLYIHGPLGTIWRVSIAVQSHFPQVAVCQRLCRSTQSLLYRIQVWIDGRFDRIHGTDTAGVILLKNLQIRSDHLAECNRYGPMPVRIFRRIMERLPVDPHQYEFVDFGSGKGRVLLLASEYEFRKITGVEFAPELHAISLKNVALQAQAAGRRGRIECLCLDATDFALPAVPVVLFFHSPFTGRVMERVLANVMASFAAHPRDVVLIFYGHNSQSIDLFKATKWPYTELSLRADWSRFTKFRSFIFTSPRGDGRRLPPSGAIDGCREVVGA